MNTRVSMQKRHSYTKYDPRPYDQRFGVRVNDLGFYPRLEKKDRSEDRTIIRNLIDNFPQHLRFIDPRTTEGFYQRE